MIRYSRQHGATLYQLNWHNGTLPFCTALTGTILNRRDALGNEHPRVPMWTTALVAAVLLLALGSKVRPLSP